jgi:hypothetical protein
MIGSDPRDLPPKITAPGVQPQPTLFWYRDRSGALIHDLAFSDNKP